MLIYLQQNGNYQHWLLDQLVISAAVGLDMVAAW